MTVLAALPDACPAQATPPDPVEEAWSRYTATGDPQARDALLAHYAPLATATAAKVARGLNSRVEVGDLITDAFFGLAGALERYEPGRAVPFEAFASVRIRGAVLDGVRAGDWVPRSVRSSARTIDAAHAALTLALHREPTTGELADHLGVPARELASKMSTIARTHVASLDGTLGAGSDQPLSCLLADPDPGVDPAARTDAQVTRDILCAAIRDLPERDKLVVSLYYFEMLTLAEIGKVLRVTESRVSQIHAEAVRRLRLRIQRAEAG